MRRPSAFKKTDVTRATLAVRAAGLQIDRVEIAKDGSIIVVPVRSIRADMESEQGIVD
jgi:hypothetical protein